MIDQHSPNAPIVFIDDAHTFGGTQTSMAWMIRVLLLKTEIPVMWICTARTRAGVEGIVGSHPRLEFVEAPSALPLNLFAFPLRLPAYWTLLHRIRRSGVRGWCLSLADIEFGLAPLLVLRSMGEEPRTYLHGTGRFVFFHRAGSWKRRLLSRVRDMVANRFVFRLHTSIATHSRASQAEVDFRVASRKRPHTGHLYVPPVGLTTGILQTPAPPSAKGQPIELWMIGNVIQGHKNCLAALDLLEQLALQGHAATLTIAGVGPDLERLQQEGERRGLADRITYLGWLADPCATAPKHAIVFVPSFHETMNLVAREAMRYGLRLVVSPIPVFHEWIPGALIADDFSPRAFAARTVQVSGMSADELAVLYRNALDQFSDEIFLENFFQFMNLRPDGT